MSPIRRFQRAGQRNKSSHLRRAFYTSATLALLSGMCLPGHADTINWTLAGNGSWGIAANWTDTTNSTHVVPGTTDTVTISNGSVVSKTGAALPLNANSLTISGSTLSISSTPTYNIATTVLQSASYLAFNNAYTLNNNTISFGDTNRSNSVVIASGATLTLGAGELVHGNSGRFYDTVDGATLANAGTISADVSGGILNLGNDGGFGLNITNTGTLSAKNGGTLSLGGATLTNTGTISAAGANSTVSLGGTVMLGVGSALTTSSGGAITISGTTTNNGTITVTGAGSSVHSAGGANAGTISIGSGATGAFSGDLTQTGGSVVVDGTYSGSGHGITVNGGTLTGSGTVVANVVNNSGSLNPSGTSTGKLTINGNYTQGSNGNLTIDLGGYGQGTTYDLLNLTGNGTTSGIANLGGSLDINLENGFTPVLNDTFTFLDYASHAGTFSSLVSSDSRYTFDVNFNGANAQLKVIGISAAATPEPGTWALLGGLGISGFAILRRRRKGEAVRRSRIAS